VRALTALPRQVPQHNTLAPEALEALVLVCLEGLANMAQAYGQRSRASRLLEAARLLRQDPDAASDPSELTPREWEVAVLVARGHFNRQIADDLVVSERTVDTHVSHILRKLHLVSRAQIAAWVVGRQGRFKLLS
jgi:DNA-binding NarL/FixJ family response regulator